MNYSRQRELIKREVKKDKVHPTADMVYASLKESNPTLSLGTVYRNLNLLSELGEIRKIPMPNSRDRFDGDVSEHYHVICKECGRVFDVSLERLKDLDEEIERQSGFEVTSHELIVTGLCPECKNNKEKRQ